MPVSGAGSVTPGTGTFGTYNYDSLGRPTGGIKSINKPQASVTRDTVIGNCATAVGKIESPTAASGTDQGGHMIGLQLGGWGLRANLNPQYNNFNTYVAAGQSAVEGNWLQLETAIKKCQNLITKTATVTVAVSNWNTATGNRPYTWKITVDITGLASISGTFDNTNLGGTSGTSTRSTMVSSLQNAGCL